MPSALADAHIEGERRLRLLVTAEVERIWRDLPGYDRENVDEWLSRVLPVISAGQRASASLTAGYLARSLGRPPVGIAPEDVIGAAVRNGTDPATVYERPLVTLWSALGDGALYNDAVNIALNRALEMARFDVQGTMRATASAFQASEEGIYGYMRVADPGACEFCSSIDGAYVKDADAMPLHPGCGCGLEPLTAPHPRAAKLPAGTAVHTHGEMGPTLGSSDHDFTTQAEIPAT